MTIIDLVIPIWVISALVTMVVAMAQWRRPLPWLALALLTGPIAVGALLLTKSPVAGLANVHLCNRCFDRVEESGKLCRPCEDLRRSRTRHVER